MLRCGSLATSAVARSGRGSALRVQRAEAEVWRCYLSGELRQLRALSSRSFSSQVQTRGPASGDGVSPWGGASGTSLAELSDRAGFLPRPEVFDERLKPGFRGGRALLIFFLCNAVPFSALLYYLREQRSARSQLSLLALPSSPDDAAAEALRVMRTSAVCFLLQDAEAVGTSFGGALRVDPHPAEIKAYVPPTEPLALIPQLERNVITDLFEAPVIGGLGFVHFAVSRRSAEGAAVAAGRRRAGLLYMSHTRGAYCTVSGQLSVLADPESKRRYWKGNWSAAFPPPMPSASGPPSAAPGAVLEEIPPWMSEDYLLLRLAVDEASVQSVVDGPQRWDTRRVKRNNVAADAEGCKWKFVAPGAF